MSDNDVTFTGKKPDVAILMSTYNGEKFLKDQIESILTQEKVSITLYIRDDGSDDNTVEIINNYINENVHIWKEKNIGCGNSFWKLMTLCGEHDYYAFSDQDDVWLPTKLIRAITYINESQRNKDGVLYCGNFWLVDDQLNKVKQEPIYSMGKYNVDNLIVTNLRACGNTMVWNSNLHKAVLSQDYKRVIDIRLHDLWIEFFAAMIGSIIIDPERVILYRQHGDNVSGGSSLFSIKSWIRARSKQIISRLKGSYSEKHYDELKAQFCLQNYRMYLSDDRIHSLELVAKYRESFHDTLDLLHSEVCRNTPLRVKFRVLMHRI